MSLTHVFFDIGGVLGTNGWDREQRQHAVEKFGLDAEFEQRHDELVGEWEIGRVTLEEYLNSAVFFIPRPFTPEAFREFMFNESKPFEETIAMARELAARKQVELFTLNNESAELNQHRIDKFGLGDIFSAFLSSCWLGIRKPYRAMFERSLGIVQAEPGHVLLVDDREQNIVPARQLGFLTHHYKNPEGLRDALTLLNLL
ncbi:MAG: HAD family hydrolase [Gemmatimonadota bacterium]